MKTVFAKEYGILPNQKIDYTDKICDMLRLNPNEVTFIFETGKYNFYSESSKDYDIYISNSYCSDTKKVAILLENMSDVTIDFNDSELTGHGPLLPILVENSRNIKLKNVKIDWDIPLSAEGKIVNVTEQYYDIQIDRKQFPFTVEDGKLFFELETSKSAYFGLTVFDGATKKVAYQLGDNVGSDRQEKMGDELVRFYYKDCKAPRVGDYAVLRHTRRIHPAALIDCSKDISLENITVYNCGGLGILSQFSENISAYKVNFMPNEEKGRCFLSGHDDGLHFSNVRGKIEVDSCYFFGLMDDPINIHSTSADVVEMVDRRKVRCQFVHVMSVGFPKWGFVDDIIAFLDKNDLSVCFQARLKSYKLIEPTIFELEFYEDISFDDGINYAVENLSSNAEAYITNSFFGSSRARGVLVTTPKKVEIKHNIFESAGSAILIAGDANYWYELGCCKDVTISENVFEDCCLTSYYQFCEGIISICPEIIKPNLEKPFHHNIKIHNNIFKVTGNPILYGLSTDHLSFTDNTIVKSNVYKPWHSRKEEFELEFCSNVVIEGNRYLGN